MERDGILNKLQEDLKEIVQNKQQQQSPAQPATSAEVKPKPKMVIFDKSTNPFKVLYSERGFEIEGTRFSFEFIETALSKEVSIVLNKGQGLVLDSIKMNKILKYKS